jgi:hypothetical protein
MPLQGPLSCQIDDEIKAKASFMFTFEGVLVFSQGNISHKLSLERALLSEFQSPLAKFQLYRGNFGVNFCLQEPLSCQFDDKTEGKP